MKTIKFNSTGEEVRLLRSLLGMTEGQSFDVETNDRVVDFQKRHGLAADGIVCYRSWEALLFQDEKPMRGISDNDFKKAARLLDCEPEALKAVQMVET